MEGDYPCPVKGDIGLNLGHHLHLTHNGDPGILEIIQVFYGATSSVLLGRFGW